MKRTLMRLLAPFLAVVIGLAGIAIAADNYGIAILPGTNTAATTVKKAAVEVSAGVFIDKMTLVDQSGTAVNPTAITALPTSGYSCSMTFTPAASSHTAGDANGAAATCATIGPSGKEVIITSGTLEIDGTGVEASAWRVYLYSVTPPSATADDAAWDLPSGDRASYLGYVDLGTAVDLGSTQWVQNHILNQQVKLAGTSLFGYLVNLSTVSTAAVAHIVTLHTVAP